MSRIFLSHSSRDNRQAIALRQWLIGQDARLADEIFLDLDASAGIRTGTRWKEALRQASTRCEAVICLLSDNWLSSPECITEYRFAEYLNKRIFSARIGATSGEDPTAEWQRIDLVGDGALTAVDIGDGAEPVAFLTDGLRGLRDGIVSAGIGAESFAWPPAHEPDRAPYRGWNPLEEVDAAVFFGRDAQIVRGLDALRGMRRSGIETLFVVLGPSGTGKSSFLRAGLLPRLRRDDRDFALLDIVRPQRNVLTGDAGLAKAVHATHARFGVTGPDLGEIKRACVAGDSERVRQWLLDIRRAAAARLLTEARQPPPTLVLPVDQAEELFGADAGREAVAFLELIADLAAAPRDDTADVDLIVAVTIRSDLYEPLQTAPQLAEVGSVLFDDLKPMPRTQFKEVITGPAARATQGGRPLSVDPALVNHLLDDCTEGADTLPLLALTLARLYEDYGDDGALTLRDYRSMGGVRSVVQSEIDHLLSFDDERRVEQLQHLRSAFIPWLATISPDSDQPVRRAARWTDLPPESRSLLEGFVARRLLVRDTHDGEVVVEVALESLLRQWDDLATWLAEERGDLKDADHLERSAAAWEDNNRNPAWLLEGTRLADAEKLSAKTAFRDRLAHVHDFLAASRRRERDRIEAEDKRRIAELEKAQAHAAVLRKRSLVLRLVLVVALLIAAAAVYGFVTAKKETDRANERTREALGLRLTYQGQAMLAGIQGGGDIRALSQILAAQHVMSDNVGGLFTAALMRIDTTKIIQSNAPIMDVTYSTDGQRLVSGGADHTVRVWDAHTGAPVGPPMMQTNAVTNAALSDDGKDVAFASADSVRVWNALTGQPVDPPMLQNSAVTSLDLSDNGQLVAAGSPDGTTRIWNAATAVPLAAPMAGQLSPVTTVDFSDDGQRVAVGDANGTLRVWNTGTGQPITPPMTGHTGAVTTAAFSPDGQRVVSGGADHTVRLWNADTGQPIGVPMTGHQNTVTSVVFNPDGGRIASGSFDGTLRIWDASTQQPVAQPMTGHVGSINAVSFSPDGHRLLTGGADETLRVWDADVGPQPTVPANSAVTSVTVSTDRHRIVSGNGDGTVRLWDADNRSLLAQLTNGRHAATTSVAISPDGRSIASGAADGTVQRWNAETKTAVGPVINAHKGAVTSLTYSWNGSRLGSGGADNTARVWDLATGHPVGTAMTGHTAPVLTVAFSPNGQLLLSGSADTTLRMWNTETGKPVGTPMTGHTAAVTDVAFGPGGGRMVSRSEDHTLRLWDAASTTPVGPPMNAHNAYMLGVQFSADGQQLLSDGAAPDRRLFPPPALTAWPNLVCAKLSANLSHQQWHDWVAPDIAYTELCPGLPVAPEGGTG
ncbi:TIR domain-containing protein [Mycobacterium sp. OAE908]|uniref:nSTAND1 domain-containing NTPase n=1 Tax=Mycobacterium sp. OAE908 TaxID=2817899 RepID=UPI001AE3ADEC